MVLIFPQFMGFAYLFAYSKTEKLKTWISYKQRFSLLSHFLCMSLTSEMVKWFLHAS